MKWVYYLEYIALDDISTDTYEAKKNQKKSHEQKHDLKRYLKY